jgi:glycosyltransferase involved in cell wall biosynthesis
VKCSILIPTLGRAYVLLRLIHSVRFATPVGRYEMIFVVDADDENTHRVLHAVPEGDVRIVVSDGTYPEKTNAGYRASEGELILPTADDVRFYQDWYWHALIEFQAGADVVGTNDLSPATEAGENVTMPIIRRAYIEDPGCVYADPGIVFHEGYHHNFVETEVWEFAVHRGVARFARDSIIEHLHPDWGKRELDATDEKGMRSGWEEDQALFHERSTAWT